MGNHNSHTTGGRTSLNQQQWTHSFPRELQRVPHLKVLPEDGLGQRLRTTDNGAILNTEGTIRGKRSSFRRGSEDLNENGKYLPRNPHDNQSIEPFHRSRTQMYRDKKENSFNLQAKRFGSEPDLRSPNHSSGNDGFGAKNKISKGRKKYKAPAPPVCSTGEESSPDSYHWELTTGGDNVMPQRKLRLFKTRIETHKHAYRISDQKDSNQPANNNRDILLESKDLKEMKYNFKNRNSLELGLKDKFNKRSELFGNRDDDIVIRGREYETELRSKNRNSAPPVMHRSLSSPEFQAELRAVTQKLRVTDRSKFETKGKIIDEPKPTTSDITKQNYKDKHLLEKDELIKKPYSKSTNFQEMCKNKMVTMDYYNLPAKQELIKCFKENVEKSQIKSQIVKNCNDSGTKFVDRESSKESEVTEGNNSRGQPSGKESTPEQSPTRKAETRKSSEEFKTPTKTFYFGMDNTTNSKTPNDKISFSTSENKSENLIKKEIENIMSYKIQRQSSSESALSSEPDLEDSANSNDISMQLRPTLPKKQLDIPRFSPATAWRLLTVVDTSNQTNSSNENEESPVLVEERIERLARPTPNIPLLGQRSSHDKSGDSGISGDAGPTLIEDILEPPTIPHAKVPSSKQPLVAWTPQQDLEEEASSSDGGLEIPKVETPKDIKFHARNHVFSLSLPRESQLSQYMANDKSRSSQGFNSLQKLKRSLGAALSNRTRINEDFSTDIDNNWFLSTSAPNSLNHNSPLYRLSKEQEEEEEEEDENKNMTLDKEPTMLKSPSFTYLANGGHVMYLPTPEHIKSENRKNNENKIEIRSKNHYFDKKYRNDRVKSIEIPCRKEFGMALKRLPISKSCENISEEMKQINRTPSPNRKYNSEISAMEEKRNKPKSKRFTFQSTVRQIERRRIAEKLSREAERKERQRLSELEAMRRVEEEFQKKRAKEKASIRQQLRLYSLDERNHNLNWDENQLRSEPDGAVSSSPAPSPTNNNARIFSKLKDNQTPYVNKIVEKKMSKSQQREQNNNIENISRSTKLLEICDRRPSPEITKRLNKNNHRSSPISRSSDDSRIKTEILSEYRQPIREYREYRGLPRYNNFENTTEHQTTVHPQVVYNMPKAKQGNTYHEAEGSMSPHSDNYRRDFAHGAIPTSSDSELSQPNTRSHSPRHLPRYRARSASPTQSQNMNTEDNNTLEDNLEKINFINCTNENAVSEKEENSTPPPPPLPLITDKTITLFSENVINADSASKFNIINPKPFSREKSFKPVLFKVK